MIHETKHAVLLIAAAKKLGITVPITTWIGKAKAEAGEFDGLLRDAAQAGRRAALVDVGCGRVEVWAEPLKKKRIPLYRDYAETGMGPSELWRNAKKQERI